MQILKAQRLEECRVDGTIIYGYRFDTRWTRKTILRLQELGRLEYYPQLPRPFFRLCTDMGLQIKGVEGKDTCSVTVPGRINDSIKSTLEAWFCAA